MRIAAIPIKASPLDIEAFHEEITVKYPTFAPTHVRAQPAPDIHAPTPVPTSRLAQAYSPIPVRHHYEHDETEQQQPPLPPHMPPHAFHPNGNQAFRPMPATPAPSPPPALPKPKKQQFQTDQTRPFLFPFSRAMGNRSGSLVPFAIDEADKLYHKHMYVSLSLWQMWRTREECMTRESGLERMPGSQEVIEPRIAPNVSGGRSMWTF